MAEKDDALIAKQDEVMKYLTDVLRGESVSEELVVVGVGEGMSDAMRVNKNPSERERLKAAELLGKVYGVFTEKVSADVDTELHISIDYGGGDDA